MQKLIVAHRANLHGPSREYENRISSITNCINLGFDVEVDVRFFEGELYLGHDEPQEKTDMDFLSAFARNLWIHCKDIHSLHYLLNNDQLNCFFHDVDECSLTSKRMIWTYPGKHITDKSLIVAKSLSETIQYMNSIVYGVCTDFGGQI